MAVNSGSQRFHDIQRAVPNITTRVLFKELKDLEENRLLAHTVYDILPVSVIYTVTPYCISLRPMVDEMIKWGENHRAELKKVLNNLTRGQVLAVLKQILKVTHVV